MTATPESHSSAEPIGLPAAVEKELHAMTTWTTEHPALWEKAIERMDAATSARADRHRRFWTKARHTKPIAAVLGLVIFSGLLVSVFLPALGKARSPLPSDVDSRAARERAAPSFASNVEFKDSFQPPAASPAADAANSYAHLVPFGPRRGRWSDTLNPAPADSTRQVIRKATLELATPDVAAAFAKAQQLLRADLGEYVESSSLTGEGKDARAQVVLRIAADHLDDTLNKVRALAGVKAESVTGDDVTAQAVDLDARIRNERSVEAEMLELLTARRGAPLADVLTLREKLSNVREAIERLQGQRDHLTRQVSLATVLVIIRPEDARTSSDPDGGLVAHFLASIDRSWQDGARTLADSVAWLVRVAVGGLFWWLVVVAGMAVCVRLYRTSRAAV